MVMWLGFGRVYTHMWMTKSKVRCRKDPVCLCVLALHQLGHLSSVYPAFEPAVPGTGLIPPTNLWRINGRRWMDKWQAQEFLIAAYFCFFMFLLVWWFEDAFWFWSDQCVYINKVLYYTQMKLIQFQDHRQHMWFSPWSQDLCSNTFC